MHTLGLLPLVKTFRIREHKSPDYVGGSPELSICCIQLQFFALANVHGSKIEHSAGLSVSTLYECLGLRGGVPGANFGSGCSRGEGEKGV